MSKSRHGYGCIRHAILLRELHRRVRRRAIEHVLLEDAHDVTACPMRGQEAARRGRAHLTPRPAWEVDLEEGHQVRRVVRLVCGIHLCVDYTIQVIGAPTEAVRKSFPPC
eukprot:5209715-Prymnesium_polylepis.1